MSKDIFYRRPAQLIFASCHRMLYDMLNEVTAIETLNTVYT
jgi:hypothetical protein